MAIGTVFALASWRPATWNGHDESPRSPRRRRAPRHHPAGGPSHAPPGQDLGLLLVHGRGRSGRPHAPAPPRASRLSTRAGPPAGPSLLTLRGSTAGRRRPRRLIFPFMVTLTVNGRRVTADAEQTILDAARAAGIADIPTLCWYPKLPIVGNCRICLVSVEGQAKLLPACATKVADGQIVQTESHAAVENRKGLPGLLH